MAADDASHAPVIVNTGAPPQLGLISTIGGGAIDALKTSPVLLLIVLLNGIFACAATGGVGKYT